MLQCLPLGQSQSETAQVQQRRTVTSDTGLRRVRAASHPLLFFIFFLSEWQQSHGANANCMWWLITWAETFKRSATHLKERGLRRCWSGKISLTLSLEATPCPASHCAAPVKTNMFSLLGQLSQAVSSQVTYPHTHPLMPPFASARSNLHDSIPIVQIKGRD